MTANIATHLNSRYTAPLDPFNANVWGRFVDRVIQALVEAEGIIRSGNAPVDYLTMNGWWRNGARKIGRTAILVPAENSITDLLVRTLEGIRGKSDKDDLLRAQDIQFSQQAPRKTQKRIGSQALTTDIRAHSGAFPDLDLRIESKVLFGGNDLTAYCGRNGLLRFGDVAEPYTDAPVGMMLAYTVRHDKAHWKRNIIGKAHGGADVLSAGHLWYASDVIRLVDCTTVLHLALDFDTDPEARAEDLRQARSKSKATASRKVKSNPEKGCDTE